MASERSLIELSVKIGRILDHRPYDCCEAGRPEPKSMEVHFGTARKSEIVKLLTRHHYIGAQCADPTLVCVWRRTGGLFGDKGDACAAAVFAPSASFAWGKYAIELVRLVRDNSPMPPLSRLLSESSMELRKRGYRLIVAYADLSVGHHGGIYQSASWIYLGLSTQKVVFVHRESGKRSSQRSFDQSNYDPKDWDKVRTCRKYVYVHPLTKTTRRKFVARAKPYPKPTLRKQNVLPERGCILEIGHSNGATEN